MVDMRVHIIILHVYDNIKALDMEDMKVYNITLYAAHKETSALLRSTQNIVRRKHHVPVHGVPSTAIIVPN